MPEILLLGAGYVTTTVVEYLSRKKENIITIAARTEAKAKQRQKENAHHPEQIKTVQLDIEKDDEKLEVLMKGKDLVISLLPYVYHVKVAKSAIRHKVNMMTSSYVSAAMKELDGEAKKAGISIMNELGVDPGIDYLASIRIIRKAEREGGYVEKYTSWCGGLPAPKDIGDNPLQYKFSWSPKGVLMAGGNEARYIEDGKVVIVPPQKLLTTAKTLANLDKDMVFEGYPNRDSTAYKEKFGLTKTTKVLRGTLRFKGYCTLMSQIKKLGLANFEKNTNMKPVWNELLAQVVGASDASESAITAAITKNLGVSEEEGKTCFASLKKLGVFSNEPINKNAPSVGDALSSLLEKKFSYGPGEQDMIFMANIFEIVQKDGSKKTIISKLVCYGDDKYSSMARTTGLPCACGSQLMLDGKITKLGVFGPTEEAINDPIIEALKGENIEMDEQVVDQQ